MRLIDLTGQKFNRLLVIKRDLSRKGVYWICQCDCGNQVSVLSQNLRTGNTQSCGCLNREKLDNINTIDLTGKIFGDLIVLERDYSKKRKWSILEMSMSMWRKDCCQWNSFKKWAHKKLRLFN